MGIIAKFSHINLIAEDWKTLMEFYIKVFGCIPVFPERNLSGEEIEKITGIKNVRITGMHLRFPGAGQMGPTLEIFQYSPEEKRDSKPVNRNGFAHIAFDVHDVEETLAKIIEHGGGQVGEVVKLTIEGKGTSTYVYARDPEDNIVELKSLA